MTVALQFHKVLNIRRSESNARLRCTLGDKATISRLARAKIPLIKTWPTRNTRKRTTYEARQDATLAGVWLWLFGEHPAMTKGETLACYNPASPACYKPPSVTALSSAAATTKERAGSIPSRETHVR